MNRKDPLKHYYTVYGYMPEKIRQIVPGSKYVAVLLKSGHLGVCSTLMSVVKPADTRFSVPNLSVLSHRIVYNAYLNALLNYRVRPEGQKDIFDHIDFSSEEPVVMIGNFRPLVKKFREAGFPLAVFDRVEDDDTLHPYNQLQAFLSQAKTVILTSTTLFNKTFVELTEQTPEGCRIFILGPSSILDPDLKTYRNVVGIYGVLFGLFDLRIPDLIGQGHGTRTFLRYAKKVNI